LTLQDLVIEALLDPATYPEETGKVELVQTHISLVFLTDKFAYKVKKAVNFGFLDFSTLEKRREYCQKELELNKRLCPKIYLDVVSINKANSLRVSGDGPPVEFALKMKRLPQEKIMTELLKEDKVDKKIIDELAKLVASFHIKAQNSSEINQFGSPATIKENWQENFAQTEKYVGVTITKSMFENIQKQINSFIKSNRLLLQNRIDNSRIRDCHGDLHSGNIFITDSICVFDAIEFNDRFRYSDVAADVAFLAMDLDYQNKPDFSEYFIERYIAYSGDNQLLSVLTFYKCYRAYVRGKVVSFRLDDPNIKLTDKEASMEEAESYFKLSEKYAEHL
jgi:aminoglycoside phosphotransferase family enzyme